MLKIVFDVLVYQNVFLGYFREEYLNWAGWNNVQLRRWFYCIMSSKKQHKFKFSIDVNVSMPQLNSREESAKFPTVSFPRDL